MLWICISKYLYDYFISKVHLLCLHMRMVLPSARSLYLTLYSNQVQMFHNNHENRSYKLLIDRVMYYSRYIEQ